MVLGDGILTVIGNVLFLTKKNKGPEAKRAKCYYLVNVVSKHMGVIIFLVFSFSEILNNLKYSLIKCQML